MCATRLYHIPDIVHGPSQLDDVLKTKKTLAHHPMISGGRRAILYLRECDRALLVPAPLTIGVDELESTSDLHTFQWLNEFGEQAAIIRPDVTRTAISRHPKSRAKLPWTLIVCVEDHHDSRPNYLLHTLGVPFAGFENVYMPNGNVLVLKRSEINCKDILDVNPSDLGLITDVIVNAYIKDELPGAGLIQN
ncbi:uncharacterized protein F5891DRAFT_981698 [Suillus fuscotomentosus]|uniref:Uncharacterized protein n=1 Tax=Suillus fuscotomentosus TaxID=1912939 RepID=A0AAD4E2H9_9AGAM|nr:uncharacterized protein F5891DRAFT_981698 [Suillus fuscotomentosus]KAG1898538.1 hypothetical protein F5891DRAFT_981698 [Suillus fuscotomentosus]